jgi:subtilisin family serine protease
MRDMTKIIKVFLSLAILLLVFSLNIANAEKKIGQDKYTLEVKDNLISLQAENVNFKEILRELERKTGIKVKIYEGVKDRKVSLKIKDLPTYALSTLLEKMSLKNFAVVYDQQLATKVIYILPEGKDIAKIIKGKAVIRPASFADGKNINLIKGNEITTITKGKNNVSIRYVKEELLLKFHHGVTEEEIKEVLNRHNLILVDDESLSKIGYIKVWTSGREVKEVIKKIGKEYKVKVPEPNYIAEIMAVTDPLYENQWYVPDTNFDKAWDTVESKNKVNIAVIDTGVNADHPDLKGKVVKGYDFVNSHPDAYDDHGHGTFVTGIISATANEIGIKGLHDNAQIISIKVLNENGIGTYQDVARGILYAADNGAQVINLSIGGYAYSFMLQDAVNYALSKGCIVVAAGGNDGIEQAIYPAAYPDVIGVSALGYNGQNWSGSNSGMHIDVSAPGVDILSTGLNSDYVYATGTSASTPMVSALAGMLISEKPELSSSFIEGLILQSANDLGDNGRDNVYGSGKIDALAAIGQEVEPFHDVAVRSVSVEPLVFEKGRSTFVVANIENIGTYKSEKVDVVLYRIIGEEKTEIGRKNGVTVIDKTKVIFDWKPESLKESVKFEVTVFSEDDNNSSNNSKTTYKLSLKESDGLYVLYKVEPPVHQWIAYQAYKLLPDNTPIKSEFSTYIGATSDDDTILSINFNPSATNWANNYDDGSSIIEGTWEEDKPPVYPGGIRWLEHYWEVAAGYDVGLWLTFWSRSALVKAYEDFWSQIISEYSNGNKQRAYYLLGRLTHLLEDMSVPPHTLNDAHPPGDLSAYEEYTAATTDNSNGNYKNINSSDASSESYSTNIPGWYYMPSITFH